MPLPAGRLSPLSPNIQLPPSLTLALVGIFRLKPHRHRGRWVVVDLDRVAAGAAVGRGRLGLGNKQSHPKLVDRGRAAPNGLVVALLAAQLRMNRAFMEYMRQNHAKYAKV